MSISKYENGKLIRYTGGTTYCLPVGTIFPSAIPLTDSSVHILDGTLIAQRGIYSEFAKLLKSLVTAGYNISCTQTEFDNDVSSTGNCGRFVIDDTLGTIRLPKITRFIQGLSNMIDIGKSVEAGLPNITGTDRGVASQSFGLSGAFYEKSMSGTGTVYQDATTDTSYTRTGFDASRSSSIYGNSNTVQPQATSFPYYIVLANGFVSDVKLNIDNFINDLNNKLSKTDIVRYVTEKYISSDGLTTYTIYNDGWKECSGFITRSNNSPVTLPVTFSNTNYKIFLTAETRNTTILAISYESKTSNSFVARMDSWTGTFNYYCCGY